MPRAKLPINAPLNLNVDEASLSGQEGAYLIDGYVDETASNRRRPGMANLCDTTSLQQVDGAYWWDEKSVALVVSGGNVYKISDSSGTIANITSVGATLVSGTRVTFTSDGTRCYMANGGRIIYTDGLTTTQLISGSPASVTHVSFFDQYILANSVGTNRFYISNYGDGLTWSPSDFFTAETLPDAMIAITTGWREVLLWGRRSIETWFSDVDTPFRKMEGAYIERGVKAKYSIAFADNTWFFIDEDKNVIMMNGRTPKVVSTKIQKEIWGFSNVDDAIGEVISIDGRYFYVLIFPTIGRTFAYEFRLGYWSEWSWWNPTSYGHEQWRGLCSCWAKDFGFHLIGDRVNGKIYKMLPSVYQDFGGVLRTVTRSSWIDHNTYQRKACDNIYIRVRRGDAGLTSDATLMVRWRNDGNAVWQNWNHLSLGKTGDNEHTIKMSRLGCYRSRQWEFAVTDNVPLALVGVEEDVSLLRD